MRRKGKDKKKSLEDQATQRLQSMLCIGRSRHQDKLDGVDQKGKIYSWESYHTYKQQACLFLAWCRERHGCKTLEECRRHVVQYLREGHEHGWSAATVSTKAAAAVKLFQCEREELGIYKNPKQGYVLPERSRDDITRTRTLTTHWSPSEHPEIAAFLSSTGLRRHEAEKLRGGDFVEEDGHLFVHVRQGKGGKPRYIPVTGEVELVRKMMKDAGEGLVFPKGIQQSCPVHYFRAVYATRLYDLHARSLEECRKSPFLNPEHWNKEKGVHEKAYDKDGVYWCRGDRKGEWMDKEAMMIVSRALGHNRISVAGAHYIHNTEEVLRHGEREDDR